ncbi:MAG: STAS domain-containing protein [Treponema sp.]|nr:STAS domain-containing protein [Treponema sp.]
MSNNEIIQGFDDEQETSLVIEQETSLAIKLTRIDTLKGGLLVYLMGYLDTYNTDYFQKRVIKGIEAGYTKLIFQCGELTYLSSTGIGSFSRILKLVQSQGGNIVFCDLQPKVYEIFQLLGFTEVFIIKNTLDASLDVFRNRGLEESNRRYPMSVTCPVCARPLQAVHPGRFHCVACKTILAIDKQGQVFLG